MSANIARRSRLRFSTLLTAEGYEFWDSVDYPVIPEQPDDQQYQVTSTDRLDLLAYRFYGDQIYWWVLAIANSMELIQTELVVGRVLRIPAPRYVRATLFAKARV
jgi:hypothetical protein